MSGVVEGSSAGSAGNRRRSLRNTRIRTKLAMIAGAGLLAVLAVTLVGTTGLSSVHSRAESLAGVAKTLAQLNVLRDNEGDMRVNVAMLAVASAPADVRDQMTEKADLDHEIDQTIAGLRSRIAAEHDASSAKQFDQFVAGVAAWRKIRDPQLVPAVNRGDSIMALEVLSGPLAETDDGYAAPLDHVADRINARGAPARARPTSTYTTSRNIMIVALLVGVAVAALLAFVIARLILRPLSTVSGVLARLADGDLTGSANVQSRDEVGQMAAALDNATGSLRGTIRVLSDSAVAMAHSSEELASTTTQIAENAQHTAAQAAVVSGAAERINAGVSTVASGADQMSSSISEIAKNASEAAAVAGDAVRSADSANTTMIKLGASSDEISAVVKTITAIAEQTNLLALNATIEAARAGEAGKGFAVVAGEVKELAQETAKAPESIASLVAAIQGDTAQAVSAIERIATVIDAVSGYQGSIASAVEEQSATTDEMARAVSVAASSTESVRQEVDALATGTRETTEGTQGMRAAGDELARIADELEALVGRFTV